MFFFACWLLPLTVAAQTNEFRALWIQAWGSELWTPQKISQLVADGRAGNFNALIPQVRRRGDALYDSRYEPKISTIDKNFDPLADLLQKAHDTNAGPRLEVHAWIVTYHVWSPTTTYPAPPQPDHPFNLHPNWLLKDYAGKTLIEDHYTFDPGHPEVQQHTFNVCMDILSRYQVDGLNFDYIRYSSANEGYNEVAVARFKKRYNRVATPAPSDTQWKQFRRDQITDLLRKVYLHAAALRPEVKISCDTITWSPAPASLAEWYASSAAWNHVLQDWRGWMHEGIMDLNLPMTYFRQASAAGALAYTNWSNFAKDHRYNRHVAIGPGVYLNSLAESIAQMKQARQPTRTGKGADGMAAYSYQSVSSDGTTRANFLNALVAPSPADPSRQPVFAQRVSPPEMPWKTRPTLGHLMGFVRSPTNVVDGAVVTITGPAGRTRVADGTGFYGFVDLPPGAYTVSAVSPGFEKQTSQVIVSAGAVATRDFSISPPGIQAQPRFNSIARVDDKTVRLHANLSPGQYGLEWTSNTTSWLPLANVEAASNTVEYTDTTATNATRFYRLRKSP